MAFTVSGNLKETGRFTSITWADGELIGDREALALARMLAIKNGYLSDRFVGHIGEYADLRRGIFAAYVLQMLFVSGTAVFEGDVPMVDPISEGGVS